MKASSSTLLVCAVYLLVLTVCSLVEGTFNFTKCPASWELQSDVVKKSFNLTKFQGTYYELALHDYTQKPLCPDPSCIRSHKVVDYRLQQVNETFNLECVGHDFTNHFYNNITKTPGFFLSNTDFIPGLIFPDTVVDVHENSNGEYEWVIEFQCLEKFDHVWYVAINWYCRENKVSEDYYQNLLKVARTRGLGLYMDHGEGVYRINQENCKYTA